LAGDHRSGVSRNLADLRAPQVAELVTDRSIFVQPLGAVEQHGPHLPFSTDYVIAARVAEAAVAQAAEAGLDVWLLPPLAYTKSNEHAWSAGTFWLSASTLTAVLHDLGRSVAATPARRLVFLNGHGGNTEALAGATTLLRSEGRDIAWCPCLAADADAHAGHTETSVLLHISPEDVHTDHWERGNTAPLRDLMPQLRQGGVAAVSDVGVLGDPTTATAVDGARLFSEMARHCADRIARWTPDRNGMLR
jgi:mycofactocin precursor peptide peptidase